MSSEQVFVVVTIVTIAMAVISVIAVPWMLVRMPADYFKQPKPHLLIRLKGASNAKKAYLIGRNLLGLVLLTAGIAMLALPGQGILTILASFLLIDFPKKHELEKKLIARPKVHKAIDWLRQKAKKPPLEI